MKAKILTAAAVVTIALGLLGAPAYGHGPPAEHDHFLHVPGDVPGDDKVVQVGPPVCGSPQLHLAFHKFHSNVHVGQPPTFITPVFC